MVDTNPVRAKATARDYAKLYLGLRNYVQNLLQFGFTDDDVANGGSDRLIDAIIPQGSAEEIAESSTRTSTPEQTTSASSHWARTGSRAKLGQRSPRRW